MRYLTNRQGDLVVEVDDETGERMRRHWHWRFW